jgi:hypothetical protein
MTHYGYPMLEDQRCGNCRYGGKHADDELRLCRRHAPQIGKYGGEWPTTTPSQWCGEWAPPEEMWK